MGLKESLTLLVFLFLFFGFEDSARSAYFSLSPGQVCHSVKSDTLYVVKPGDSLGKILFQFNIGPLWGEQRFVDRTAKKNSLVESDKIHVGQVVVIPFRCEEELDPFVLENIGTARRIVALKSTGAPIESGQPTITQMKYATKVKNPMPPPRELASASSPETTSVIEASVAAAPVATVPTTPVKVTTVAEVTATEPPAVMVRQAPAVVSKPPPPIQLPSIAQVAKTQAAEDSEYSVFSVDLLGEYAALAGIEKANGSSGRLLTKLDPGLRLGWAQHWDDDLRSDIFLKTKSVSYASEKSGITLQDSQFTATSFGGGIYSRLSGRLEWGASLQVAPTVFYRAALVGSGLEFNSVPLIKLHPGLNYALIQRRRLSLSLLAGLSYFSNSSYDNYSIDAGYGYDLGLSMKHQFESGSDFHCAGYYDERRQNTSLLTLSEKALGLGCGFSWRLQ